MTKYSAEFKAKVVQEYLTGRISYQGLATKYEISSKSMIMAWVNLVKAKGFKALKIKHRKANYSIEYKLKVIDYYKNSGQGSNFVAAHFGISPSLVKNWVRFYAEYGIDGLRPNRKGRPIIMGSKKPKQKKLKPNVPLTEKEEYEQEIAQLKEELYYTQMERDVLKKLKAVLKNNDQEPKPK
ncbi:helix-turn-helix domain-containing protein [Bombilactobacillus bombi]|uniref:helix-turn-helix domain-containing protein n=1 Tax=Bombilactobacillus bombi TaxID=1303590 RepID=UPI0038F5EAD5